MHYKYKKQFCLFIFCLLLFVFCSKPSNQKETEEIVVAEEIAKPELPEVHIPFIERIVIEKSFLYDKYTLEDEYTYKDTPRKIQWDKIEQGLALIDSLQNDTTVVFGILQNRHNKNGKPPLVINSGINNFNRIIDAFEIEQYQGIPLYAMNLDSIVPQRYALDGSLVKLSDIGDEHTKVTMAYFEGIWTIPNNYVKRIEKSEPFSKIIFVDRTHQNIVTMEKIDTLWLVRSQNPATTGLNNPPYQHETPLGIFVVQEKKNKMHYYKDGTTEIAGYAPYASRFCNGGYIHGIPVNKPRVEMIEYGTTLGTTPRSHMCVRNATSHAKFIYDWAGVETALVFVVE